MSNRLTFSLASLILVLIVGFSLLMPLTVHAAEPVFSSEQGDITLTVGDAFSKQLPVATDADGDAIAYTLPRKTGSGANADPALSEFGLTF